MSGMIIAPRLEVTGVEMGEEEGEEEGEEVGRVEAEVVEVEVVGGAGEEGETVVHIVWVEVDEGVVLADQSRKAAPFHVP